MTQAFKKFGKQRIPVQLLVLGVAAAVLTIVLAVGPDGTVAAQNYPGDSPSSNSGTDALSAPGLLIGAT